MPMLWHIMKIYSSYGINEFRDLPRLQGVYDQGVFRQYLLHTSDVTIDLKNNHIDFHARRSEPWRVTLVDTGAETRQAVVSSGRCLTYGMMTRSV